MVCVLEKLHNTLIGVQKTSDAESAKSSKEIERLVYSIEKQMEKLYEDKVLGDISGDTFSTLPRKLDFAARKRFYVKNGGN
jgi:hypothetical protein